MVEAAGIDEIGEGDCVFLYTGHGDLWKNSEWKSLSAEEKAKRKATFISGEPGFGRSACEYFAEQKIILTGGDTSANDAQPVGEIEGEAVPCHTELQTRHGIWNIENLDFEPLLADGVSEFLFVWAPLKMVGATGSPGNPVRVVLSAAEGTSASPHLPLRLLLSGHRDLIAVRRRRLPGQ